MTIFSNPFFGNHYFFKPFSGNHYFFQSPGLMFSSPFPGTTIVFQSSVPEAAQLRGRRTLNRRGRAAAGPHSCGAAQTLNGIPLYRVLEAAQLRGRRTLNRRGRAAAGPHSCGAAENPKWHTLVHSPGSRTAAGPAHPKPAGPSSCGAAQGTGKNISAKGTGKNKPKERLAYFFSRLCIFVPAWLGGLPPVPTRSARNSIDSKTA